MKFEFSAGGIMFRRGTTQKQDGARNNAEEAPHATSRAPGAIKILLCQHSQHHGWVFPKGLIDDKPFDSTQGKTRRRETKEEAALREVTEETGAIGSIMQPLTPVTYWYQWEGEKRKKTVYYFLMEFAGGDITKHDHEMENVEWLPIEAVADRLTYPTDKKAWEEAKALLANG